MITETEKQIEKYIEQYNECDVNFGLKELATKIFELGKSEGRKELIEEMMSKHKTPANIKITPDEITLTTERMFSFAEGYSDMNCERARKETLKEVLKIIKNHVLYPTKQWQELFKKINALSEKQTKSEEFVKQFDKEAKKS